MENFLLSLLQAANEATTKQQLVDACNAIQTQIDTIHMLLFVIACTGLGLILYLNKALEKAQKEIKTLQALTSKDGLAGTQERREALETLAAAECSAAQETR